MRPAHLHAVDIGQPHVQQHQVGMVLRHPPQRLAAVPASTTSNPAWRSTRPAAYRPASLSSTTRMRGRAPGVMRVQCSAVASGCFQDRSPSPMLLADAPQFRGGRAVGQGALGEEPRGLALQHGRALVVQRSSTSRPPPESPPCADPRATAPAPRSRSVSGISRSSRISCGCSSRAKRRPSAPLDASITWSRRRREQLPQQIARHFLVVDQQHLARRPAPGERCSRSSSQRRSTGLLAEGIGAQRQRLLPVFHVGDHQHRNFARFRGSPSGPPAGPSHPRPAAGYPE